MTEYLTIFDEHMRPLGTRSRAQAHREGLWHETFHCWFFRREHDQCFLLFQQRAAQKDTFPDLLDVTAAGHLQAGETAADGIREIQEELGVEVPFSSLHSLGIAAEEFFLPTIIDREFHHVYLYHYQQDIASMHIQETEVAGIAQVEIDAFSRLINAEAQTVTAQMYLPDYKNDGEGLHYTGQKQVSQHHFCPHSVAYYQQLVATIKSWTM
jgi:isopentenyldiphosphate isomerase